MRIGSIVEFVINGRYLEFVINRNYDKLLSKLSRTNEEWRKMGVIKNLILMRNES